MTTTEIKIDIFCILLLFLISCQNSDAKKNMQSDSDEAIIVAPKTMYMEYLSNIVGADLKYKNKKNLLDSSTVNKIAKAEKDYYLVLYTGAWSLFRNETVRDIVCFIKKSEVEKCANISFWDFVKIKGECEGIDQHGNIRMYNCSVEVLERIKEKNITDYEVIRDSDPNGESHLLYAKLVKYIVVANETILYQLPDVNSKKLSNLAKGQTVIYNLYKSKNDEIVTDQKGYWMEMLVFDSDGRMEKGWVFSLYVESTGVLIDQTDIMIDILDRGKG